MADNTIDHPGQVVEMEAIAGLLVTYKPYLMKIISGFSGDPAEIEEIYQELCTRLLQTRDTFSGEGFKFWAARIAVNYCIDRSRMKDLKTEPLDEECMAHGMAEPISGAHPSPEEKIIMDQDKQVLLCFIAELPPAYREVIEAHYFSELSYREIAEKMNLSERTIETRIYRARKMIKDRWRKYAL